MTLDLVLLAIAAVFGFFGWRSGAIRQAAHWGGIACGWLGASAGVARLTPLLSPRLGLPVMLTRYFLGTILFAVCGGLGAWLIHSLLRKLAGERENGALDDAAGGLLGLAKGGALLYILLSLVVFFEGPLTKSFGPPSPGIANSTALAFVRRHGFFETVSLPAVAKLEKLLAAVRDPKGAQSLALSAPLRGMLNDPALRKTLNDDGVARALLSGDLSALKNNPRLAALLKDPRLTGGSQ